MSLASDNITYAVGQNKDYRWTYETLTKNGKTLSLADYIILSRNNNNRSYLLSTILNFMNTNSKFLKP
jgi:hypothetical protein